MTSSSPWLDAVIPLPLHIDRAELEDPTLMIGGHRWSLSATCLWRWVSSDGAVVIGDSPRAGDAIWDLVGNEIIAVHWSGPEVLGLDPAFALRSGGELDLLSDATFDTWVLRLPEVTLVGPLRLDVDL